MEKLDIPQGTLDLMILTILAREPMHGYGISQRLAVLSHDQFHVNPGSLFPSLYRLEQDGKLKAEWRATENNRRAKYYRLTASGRRQLEQHRAALEPGLVRRHQCAGGRMTLLHRLASIVRWMFRRNQAERDLNDELEAFVDMAAADQIRDGATRRRGPPSSRTPTRRRGTGQGARSKRPPWRVMDELAARCPFRTAPDPAQSRRSRRSRSRRSRSASAG